MELKLGCSLFWNESSVPLIVPYGIETCWGAYDPATNSYPLIVPYGIETEHI